MASLCGRARPHRKPQLVKNREQLPKCAFPVYASTAQPQHQGLGTLEKRGQKDSKSQWIRISAVGEGLLHMTGRLHPICCPIKAWTTIPVAMPTGMNKILQGLLLNEGVQAINDY